MLHLAVLALLADTPPAGPTPVARSSDRPRTLSDIARERKGKTKPTGSLSAAEGGGGGPQETSGSDETGRPATSKAAAALRVMSSSNSGVSRRGEVMFQGSVQNVGEGAACYVRIGYSLMDEGGKFLASGSAYVSRIEKGATADFSGDIRVPPNTFNSSNRVSSGDPNVKIRYVGRGSADVTSADPCR